MSTLPHIFITIEGNIGSGKTSLSKKIADSYGAKLLLERFDDNPFLPHFYENQDHYALHVELTFLAERYTHINKEFGSPELFSTNTVSDYMFQKCLIFAQRTLKESEFDLYNKLYTMVEPILQKPTIIFYLHQTTSNLLSNISKRGRSYEKNISAEYLNKINSSYFQYFKQHENQKVVVIDVQNLDFVNSNNDYIKILGIIKRNYPAGITRISL